MGGLSNASTINPNLASLSKLSVEPSLTYHIEGFAFYVEGMYGTNGIRFDPVGLTIGETYTFSYKFQKTGGTLQCIGGHRGGFLPINDKWTLDGVEQSTSYPRGAAIADDDAVHTVVVTAVYYGNDVSGWNHIEIQHRNAKVPVDLKVWNIKMEVGDTATAWVPAEEDVPPAPVSPPNPTAMLMGFMVGQAI